jgi:hypothetical protein
MCWVSPPPVARSRINAFMPNGKCGAVDDRDGREPGPGDLEGGAAGAGQRRIPLTIFITNEVITAAWLVKRLGAEEGP